MHTNLSPALFVSLTLGAALTLTHPAGAAAQHDEMACQVRSDLVALEGRASPLDSLTFHVAEQDVKLCYGRPSARGRTMIGRGSSEGPAQMGEIPFGKLWRTGANEPTVIHTPVALSVAGVTVEPGTYSLYTVPGATQWEIIVNRSYTQWGMESMYTDEVRAQEVGRGTVASESTEDHVETFTIRTDEGMDGDLQLILEWEGTRVRIPVSAAGH